LTAAASLRRLQGPDRRHLARGKVVALEDRCAHRCLVYDLDPHAPAMLEGRTSTEPIGLDDDEIMEDALSAVTDYGDTGGSTGTRF
jgi:hypothetical protein